MKKHLTLFVLALATTVGYAQELINWKPGELLVQLTEQTDVEQFQSNHDYLDLSNARLISRHVNVWHFDYDASIMSIDNAIKALFADDAVLNVQRNHIMTNRLEPDDPEYDEQWQYYQSNDRDIDADQAWDVTTGGLTSLGDTIVVCVIDDGVNMDHPDLIPNLWTNQNEIDGNGIDDDGNGYVDDINGWNAYGDNDNVAHAAWWEGHGSAVAGIVGAKGNDGVGVTGVNWDVKIMVVKGGGGEAQAIAAYSYALENRVLYNNTDGEKGAFVVATNASWGVDFGQAADAPIWCAMYDTLGNHGVLNAGATINGNQNVDVVGDLPTQCPSEFLITVTNTNQGDVKVTGAGYGEETIDLGAPGAGTWTVDQFSNGYASFGGTSGATPHVSGTIALLYSAPCTAFADLARSNPKLAAEKVRDYILEGVDANTSLSGITTTGGRLNVNNAIENLMDECAGSASIDEEDSDELSLVIYPNPMLDDYISMELMSDENTNGSITITDLSGKVVYSSDESFVFGINSIKIELPNLASGIYQLAVISGEKLTTKKFLR